MEIVIKILQFILSFSLLVVIHEFGHFIFARIFKTRVEKFYLFFNPWFSLFKFKKGDTEYGVGWIPFGGYVKISGMIDESMDTEQMKQPAQPYEFRSKPAWQRLLIMVGGVLMNVILAVFIYIGISYTWGDNYIASKDIKYGYVYNDLGEKMGFRDGDKIIDVDGIAIENSVKVIPEIIINQAEYVTVERDGAKVRVDINPDYMAELINSKDFLYVRLPFVVKGVVKDGNAAKAGFMAGDSLVAFNSEQKAFTDQYFAALKDAAGTNVNVTVARNVNGQTTLVDLPVDVSAEGTIGVQLELSDRFLPVSTREYSFFEAIPAGVKRTGTEISNYAKQLKLVFSPKTEAYKSLGGVITLGSIFPTYWSWESFWKITALFSIILAVMNILPIPALDGGHVMFLLYEVISRRKPSDKFMEHVQTAGVIILFALLIYANGNDIYRFFIK